MEKQNTPEQQRAIEHTEGPLLIVAGAGTGKTHVITNRIAWLILSEKAKVHELLALTFTEKAATEMEERVDKLLPYGYVDLWISTFHGFCDRILKRHAIDIGLHPNYTLLDETQAWLLVRENLDKFPLDYYRPLGNPAKFISALLKHFSRCKDEGITPKQYLDYVENLKLDTDNCEFIESVDLEDLTAAERTELRKSELLRLTEVANAYHTYQQLLYQKNALDFADLITETIRLFRERPLIYEKYHQQFKYILVDEFQDTNFVQYELVKLLAAPRNNITVVGDDDQSIYRFRGSSLANIMQFKNDYQNATEVVLTTNYRSHQQILDASYGFIQQNNPHRLEETLKINKKLHAAVGSTGKVEHLHFATVEDEVRGVVNRIIELKNNNAELTWDDFAILVRANDSGIPFVNALAEANIPYQFIGLSGLYTKPIITDIINFLTCVTDHEDSSAWFRLLSMPLWNINALDVGLLLREARKKAVSLHQIARQAAAVNGVTPESVATINKILGHIDKASTMAKTGKPTRLMMYVMFDLGYLDSLNKEAPATLREQSMYLQVFYEKLQSIETTIPDCRVADAVRVLQLEMQSGDDGQVPIDPEAGPEMVRIMTIHGAKGLEFPYVFIVNMVDRRFPTDERTESISIPTALTHKAEMADDMHLQEERRLFYVAMTRAKQAVFLTSAVNYGGARPKKLSRFLVELGFKQSEVTPSATALEPKKQVEPTTPAVEKLKHFSFSSLSTYQKCPYQFYLGYVLKIPTPGTGAMTFGDLIHKTLHEFLTQAGRRTQLKQTDLFGNAVADNATLTLDDLLKLYEKNWRDEWFETPREKETYRDRGLTMLKNFYQRYVAAPNTIQTLEQPFTVKMGDMSIKGRIDRIDTAEGGVEIIDYKTGTPKDESLSTDDKKQLILYAMAAKDVLKLHPVKLTFYYLENNSLVSFEPTEKDEMKIREKLINEMTDAGQGNYEATPNQFICQTCPFRMMCEYRKL